MRDELHRHLDGEIGPEGLDPASAREAEAWARLLESFRTEVPAASAPPWLEERVMAEIEALPEPGLLRHVGSWLLRPRPVRISPLAAGLAVAGLVGLLTVGRAALRPGTAGLSGGDAVGGETPAALASGGGPGGASGAAGTEAPIVYVQFALEAPGASSVAVAGDFDDWQGAYSLEDLDGDGVWTGRVPVRPGVHAYMFLVDGSKWMTDPHAERYADDGFGNRNAILAVAGPTI